MDTTKSLTITFTVTMTGETAEVYGQCHTDIIISDFFPSASNSDIEVEVVKVEMQSGEIQSKNE